jgi:hypothetical protein
MFLGEVHNEIEKGRAKGQSPADVVSKLRKQIVDRHEGAHLLDEWDPNQQIYKQFFSRLGNTTRQYREALTSYLFHGEVNAMIGELRYGQPMMAIDRLLSLAELARSRQKQNAELDEQQSAALWVSDTLVALLNQGWAERVGMKIVSGLGRLDQVKSQLYLLGQPENGGDIRALADALMREHSNERGR